MRLGGVEGRDRAIAYASSMDHERIRSAIHEVLEAVGEDASRPELLETPERVALLFGELFAGLGKDPGDEIDVIFTSNYDGLVLVRDIPVYSVCEHHLIPFIGKAHVGYIPNKKGEITGLSKLARVVDVAARRPQMQERLTMQIADAIESKLEPRGVIVVIEADHLCMTIRGVVKPGATTVTSAVRGLIRENQATREEAMRLIGRQA
ncbi:MAG: GTP cyclohydrolase I FolE [Actinomycetota bacterium]